MSVAYPTQWELESWKEDALFFINRERVDLGFAVLFEIPKGYRVNTCECPVAMALPGEAWVSRLRWWPKYKSVLPSFTPQVSRPITPGCTNFINAFDEGHYPELELRV